MVEELKDEVEALSVAYNGAQRELYNLRMNLRRQSDRLIKSQNENAMNDAILNEVTDELIDTKSRLYAAYKELGKMNIYYGTFGISNTKKNMQQPIEALNDSIAKKLMSEVYGKDWAFVYEECQGKDNLPMLTTKKHV